MSARLVFFRQKVARGSVPVTGAATVNDSNIITLLSEIPMAVNTANDWRNEN